MPTWEDIYKEKGIVQSEPDQFVINFAKTLKPKSKILDLGCGTGRHLVPLAEIGFQMYETDFSEQGIEICKKQLEEKNLMAEFKVEDFEKISYPNEFFDAVISTKTIHHAVFSKIRKCVDEIYRVTKRKGKILITVASLLNKETRRGREIEKNTYIIIGEDKRPYKSIERGVPHHFFSKEELKDLFEKFKCIECKIINGYKGINKNSHILFIGEKV